MIISSFGLTTAEMLDASGPGAGASLHVEPSGFTVRLAQSPGYAPTEESFFDKPWAKWAIGGGVALMLGGAYLYTRKRRR